MGNGVASWSGTPAGVEAPAGAKAFSHHMFLFPIP